MKKGAGIVARANAIARVNEAVAEVDRLREINTDLMEVLEDCAESLNFWLSKAGCPTEDSAPKSDADSCGGIATLVQARNVLSRAKEAMK